MNTFLMPVELARLDAIRYARELTEWARRKFVARVEGGKFYVVPLYTAGREGQEHDAGYAAIGSLIKESL